MKLNLCCGSNVFPGWLNVDRTDVEADYLKHLRDAPKSMVWPPEQQALVDHIEEIQFCQLDVREAFPWKDNCADAIYVGQAIEHFHRGKVPAFLSECFRVLRPGGFIKLTTPDLNQLVIDYQHNRLAEYASEQPDFFRGAASADQLSYIMFGAMGPDCNSEHYEGHFHLYTWHTLRELLHSAGFAHSAHSWPHKETIDKGMSHSFAIEGMKP